MNARDDGMRGARAGRTGVYTVRYDGLAGGAAAVMAQRAGLTERIAALARSGSIALNEDPGLIEALACLDAGLEIPGEVYALVAEVLAFVYGVDADAPAPPP